MTACSIIIPFYQSKAGVLRRALESIMAQTERDFEVIVVDDGSPRPAAEEVSSLPVGFREKVRIVEQKNAGVSAARNRGLDCMSPECELVAFLDSDDEWAASHLETALKAVRLGADFYWGAVSANSEFDSDSNPLDIISEGNIKPLSGCVGVFEVRNFNSILVGEWWRHVHISTIALSSRLAKKVRFRPQLNLCEDFAFFIDCADILTRAVFTSEVSCRRGRGDNVWHNTDFKHRRTAVERYNTLGLLQELMKKSNMSRTNLRITRLRLESAREQFYWNQASRIKSGLFLNVELWLKWLVKDPLLLATILRLRLGGEAVSGKPITIEG